MEREYEMENENYNFIRNSSQSSDKLITLRDQSQASHINRIRSASEKRRRQELERLNLEKPKWLNNMTSKKTIKKAKSTRVFSRTKELDGSKLLDDWRSLQHSGVNGLGHDVQGEMYLITPLHDSKSLNSVMNNGNKKHRKRWTKTTETMVIVPMAENESVTKRNGGDCYSEKSLSMRNIEEFNRIQNGRDVEYLDYVEDRTIGRRHAIEKHENVVNWINSLPTPESMDPIVDTVEDAKTDLYLTSKEDRVATQIDFGNHSQTSAGGYKDTKYGKKSIRNGAEQSTNTSGLSNNMPEECKDKESVFNSVSKKGEPSTLIGSKRKKDLPIQVVYTPKGDVKIIIRFKKLKPKDAALLVRFGDLKNSMLDGKNNTTSSRKVKKGFTYLNDKQMKFFDSIFLK